VSKAQVGSSAKIILGEMDIALAIATLCFCPPESSFGILLIFSLSQTFSKAILAFSVACFQDSH
jgi:hypothetical protein